MTLTAAEPAASPAKSSGLESAGSLCADVKGNQSTGCGYSATRRRKVTNMRQIEQWVPHSTEILAPRTGAAGDTADE